MVVYNYKVFENVKQAKEYLSENDIDLNNEDYLKIKHLLRKNPKYTFQFVKWFFDTDQNVSIEYLGNLFRYIKELNINNISRFDTAESLYDYITEVKIEKQVARVIKGLPPRKRNLVNKELKNLLILNTKYHKPIMNFFLKKGARYNNSNNLFDDTKKLVENLMGGWNVNSIKYNKEELVYSDYSTLILHIDSYDRSQELGSPHWCISTNKSEWDRYTKDFKKQYFIYDFSKDINDNKSLIGVTIQLNGNTKAMHLRNDDEASKEDIKPYIEHLKPHSKEYIKSKVDLSNYENIIKYGFVDELKELLNNRFDPSTDYNWTIKYASSNGQTDIVKLLLQDERVDPSAGYNYAIRYASDNGRTEIVKLLLQDDRVDPSDNNNEAIKITSSNGHTEIVKLLLQDKRVDPSTQDNWAIRLASRNGRTEIVKLLLQDKRVDPSADNNYAIRWASLYGHTEVVRLLLQDDRVDPSDRNNEAIRKASLYGHTDIVKLLSQDKRVDPSDQGNHAIRWASEYSYTETVKLLLQDKRVDPSDVNNEAIRYASKNGNTDVVKLLLQDDRVDPSDDDNFAIRLATRYGHTEVVRLLLQDDRVDPSDRNNYAIRWASENGQTETVKLLLQDDRVKNSLTKEDYDMYSRQIN